jgi:GNAT superfamily N-acetyltransferase
MTNIKLATTDEAINSCYPVMVQLRPHIAESDFLPRVKAQLQQGFNLAYLEANGQVVACAGYRYGNNLAWGKFLYVDDLITDAQQRSKGYGKQLLDWLQQQARDNDCDQFHLDSGTQRKDAHRFYEREGMSLTAYHYVTQL